MTLSSLKNRKLKRILMNIGYSSLYPIQEQAISNGLLQQQNLLITSPTASGKTLIAMLAAIKTIEKNKKVVYMTPLRSLATEKYNDFLELKAINDIQNKKTNFDTNIVKSIKKNKHESKNQNFIIRIASGDYDSPERDLQEADIIVLTNEKLDALIRNNIEILSNVGLFVTDEVHLIDDRDRGPTLEMMLTKIKKFYPEAQILALSATVSNPKEIAEWLDCKLIDSKWRPTKLIEGVYEHGVVRMNNNRTFRIHNYTHPYSAAVDIAIDSLENGGQVVIFAETRKRAVSLAAKAAESVFKLLDKDQREKAAKLSSQISKNSDDTELTKTLINLVSKGVGFHHAGLGQKQREIIEESFKARIIKVLSATPTLAFGVNLPARRVVLTSILRYDHESGTNIPISVMEYKQFCGRAGRPKYDTFGEAIIVSDSAINSEDLYDHYILGVPEPINSRLFNEKALLFHILSTISTLPGMKKSDIYDLFSDTLFARSYKKSTIAFKIDNTLESLEDWELVKSKNERYIATEFGKRTSVLYIDPISAVDFKNAINMIPETKTNQSLKQITQVQNDKALIIKFLHIVSECSAFYPKLSLRKSDIDNFYSVLREYSDDLILELNEYNCSRSFLALCQWINEASYRTLSDKLGIEPGDIYRIVESADWLLYSLYEFAKLFQRNDLLTELFNLRMRVKYGVKEDLLYLVRLEGIGRIRARALYDAGIKDIKILKSTPESTIAAISKIGPTIAKKIKKQLSRTN